MAEHEDRSEQIIPTYKDPYQHEIKTSSRNEPRKSSLVERMLERFYGRIVPQTTSGSKNISHDFPEIKKDLSKYVTIPPNLEQLTIAKKRERQAELSELSLEINGKPKVVFTGGLQSHLEYPGVVSVPRDIHGYAFRRMNDDGTVVLGYHGSGSLQSIAPSKVITVELLELERRLKGMEAQKREQPGRGYVIEFITNIPSEEEQKYLALRTICAKAAKAKANMVSNKIDEKPSSPQDIPLFRKSDDSKYRNNHIPSKCPYDM